MDDLSRQSAANVPDTDAAVRAAIQSLESTAMQHDIMQRLLQLYKASLANVSAGQEHLIFTIAGISCAVPLTAISEVRPGFPTITPLPFSPPWLLGIFGAHNEPVGLVDLAAYLELECVPPAHAPAAHSEAAVLLTGSEKGTIGLVVERVGDIVQVSSEHRLDPPAPGLIPDRLARYVQACLAIAPDQQTPPLPTLLLLDLPHLLHELLESAADGGLYV
jgi:purine-binding chemotaxis protein CheW